MSADTKLQAPVYNDGVVRMFTLATVFWGIVGFAAGLFIALRR